MEILDNTVCTCCDPRCLKHNRSFSYNPINLGNLSKISELEIRHMHDKREIASLKAKIKELEAAKTRDKSKYFFKVDCHNFMEAHLQGEVVSVDNHTYRLMVSRFDKQLCIHLSEQDLQTIVTTLQKVLKDGVLR